MNDNKDLFPFPTFGDEKKQDDQQPLPAFPPESTQNENCFSDLETNQKSNLALNQTNQNQSETSSQKPLTDYEIKELRKMLAAHKNSQDEIKQEKDLKSDLLDQWNKIQVEDSENNTKTEIETILATIENDKTLLQIILGLAGTFPIRKFLRHGTSEQKLFVLSSVSERFLHNISDINFHKKNKLLQIIGAYLSDVSEKFTFIQTQNETFNPQLHERVPGSIESNKKIRLMKSYLVAQTDTQRIIKTSQVIT